MSANKDIKVVGTRRAGEKFSDLHPTLSFVDVSSEDDDSKPPMVSSKVRIDPALGDDHSNLTENKMEMLEDCTGSSYL